MNLIVISLLLTITCMSCSKDKETNKQSVEQYNLDKSNNYNYIFRDIIEKQKKGSDKKDKREKDHFKD